MKNFFRSRDLASKGAALLIVLAIVIMLAGVALAYLSRTTTDRQLAQTSYNDTSADLLARSALDIVVSDLKQEIITDPPVATRNDIQPQRYGDASIPNLIRRSYNGDPTGRTSAVNSETGVSANGRFINTTRWNSHYLIPRGSANDTSINPSPAPTFVAPDWVLVTGQGPAPAPLSSAVIGRYAFAVYDEGGLLDMSLAGYPSWSGNPSATCSPAPTPWLVNVGYKGIVAFADLTALPWPSVPSPQSRIDNIVGWRNYAMTQRTSSSTFGNFSYAGDTDCSKQDFYGSYLLNFGDPPFSIDSLSDKLLASLYPFTAVANQTDPSNTRTDQAVMTRQELLKVVLALGSSSIGYNQNVLQYMGTFSRERNKPAPDWPNLQNNLSEGRFNLNNLSIVIPNPSECNIKHGKKVGWQTGKNKNHLCGTTVDLINLFGLFWVKASIIDATLHTPGHWRYIGHIAPPPDPNGTPNPNRISCFRGPNQQNDFFQVLNFAFNRSNCAGADASLAKVFGVGASLIDQYDSATPDGAGDGCYSQGNHPFQPPGCDLDYYVIGTSGKGNNWNKQAFATHTTVIEYGKNSGNGFAFGMEPPYRGGSNADTVNGDEDTSRNSDNPHLPCGGQGGSCASGEPSAPAPGGSTQVINHAYSNVGQFGYGIDTSNVSLPTLNFSSPTFPDAPILDFFSYNPISSAYPRAGVVNLYTKNAPVIAAILANTLKTDAAAANPAPTPVVTAAQAMDAATRIVQETQNVLAGSPGFGAVTQTDMTRAIAARLVAAGASAPSWTGATTEQQQSIARALAEMGQTRTWNLLIDVIAQTGQYKPNSPDLTGGNFIVQGEKRYWLHIALGRDLIHTDGTPCLPGDTGCQVDVLGSQLEEVTDQ
jgi:type II secretory pathway pseudopilin PulG